MSHSHAKHIGIVGCGSEAAALCYRTICQQAGSDHPEVSLHSHPLSQYMSKVSAGDWKGVAELLLSSAHKLASGGAQLLICPDSTVHQAFSLVKRDSPLPWLHIAVEVAREARALGYRRLAILGTRSLMESPVYADALAEADIEHCTPSLDERIELDAIISQQLAPGTLTTRSRQRVGEIVGNLECDALVLGGTELPLVLSWDRAPVPVLDATRMLARAALREAL
ncbi:MAG TPA: aspartate/glutamate racemase family protein [Polyangiales bacterium]|nr:aspartate/glutamate racemase family protein [Polyangiales bacterium]